MCAASAERRLVYGLNLAGLFVIYVVTAWVGLALDPVGGFATLVWAPTGASLAALLLLGKRLWPAIALGAFVANLSNGAPILVASGIAVGNMLEAVLGAFLLERVLNFDNSLGRTRDVLALALAGAVATPVVSATIGVTSLWAGGVIDGDAVFHVWRTWWVGDALGALIVAPMLLVWGSAHRPDGRIGRGLALVLVVMIVAFYIFDVILPRPEPQDFRSPYLVFPVLIYLSLAFRQHGAVTGTLAVWIVSIVATTMGLGPFIGMRLSQSLLPLQLFMAVVALTMLLLGAAVSERDRAKRQAETAQRHNAWLYDQAQEAVRARDVFLAVASHELRTPLAALDLQVENLCELIDRGTASKERLLTKLKVLERQSDRLGALVEILLDVSQVMGGRIPLAHEDIDLSEVVRECVARFSDQAARAGCELVVDVHECSPARGDRLRIEQILTNLLGNAIKFGAGKPIHVSLVAQPDQVEIAVRDHGPGIAAADHERIFQRFERASSHKPVGGLGLGLWIARQLALALGGSVEVESELGRGATFKLKLPPTMPTTVRSAQPT